VKIGRTRHQTASAEQSSTTIARVRSGTHHTLRISIALAIAFAAAMASVSSALGAWSGVTQVIGFGEVKNVVAGIDEDGTQQLGFFATGSLETQGLYNLTRAPGVTAWTQKKVFGPINNGRFAFARNGAAVAAWQGSGETVFAAYKPAGKAWASSTQIDNPAKLGTGPIPVISAKGAAAVVWSRKSDVGLREPDQIMYSGTSTGSWDASPSLLAPIALPQPVNTEHFLSCLPGSDLVAAMLPSGQPIAAWNDVYGSFKQSVGTPPGETELGGCGVKTATPGASPTAVSPRPAIGWNVTPPAELPFWRPVSIAVDPDSGRTALVVNGKASAVTTSCGAQPVDYCFDSTGGFGTRVLLGSETTTSGSVTANLAQVGLRNDFVAAATGSPAALAGGVGAGFPTLSPLSPNAGLVNSSIAVGNKGEAELLIHNGTKLIAYSATAGGQFGAAADIKSGSEGKPSVAIGCNGDALVAWNQGNNNLWAAVNLTGAAQCGGGGGEEPGPGPGPSPTPTPTPGGGQTVAPIVGPPTPPRILSKGPKCKKGFQKKTVRGKPKCVKKPAKGKKKR
jgi:hypothetical protein